MNTRHARFLASRLRETLSAFCYMCNMRIRRHHDCNTPSLRFSPRVWTAERVHGNQRRGIQERCPLLEWSTTTPVAGMLQRSNPGRPHYSFRVAFDEPRSNTAFEVEAITFVSRVCDQSDTCHSEASTNHDTHMLGSVALVSIASTTSEVVSRFGTAMVIANPVDVSIIRSCAPL